MSISLDTYRYVFCILVGLTSGVVYLMYKSLSGTSAGMLNTVSERNEDGDIKIFNVWNLGLFSFFTMVLFLWWSSYEHSRVSQVIQRTWDYLVEQKIILG